MLFHGCSAELLMYCVVVINDSDDSPVAAKLQRFDLLRKRYINVHIIIHSIVRELPVLAFFQGFFSVPVAELITLLF